MNGSALVQPDPNLIRDVMAAGGGDLKKCYQCATCAVTCELSTDEAPFPRPQMIAAQWGLKDRLIEDPGPWLCFYCGECSKRCPRGANPGESMMALRRYLTAQYDWTGLSRLMYRSAVWELGVLGLVALLVIALFTLPHDFGFGLLSQYPAALQTVMLDRFAPKHIVHLADNILAAGLGLLLLSNGWRMLRALTRGRSIPSGTYLKALPGLLAEAATQRRWKKCADQRGGINWVRHLVLVSGYATIFTLVVLFLPWFQVEDSGLHWTSLLGYYATAVIIGSTVWMMSDRAARRSEMHRFSHLSDWLFPILLFLTAVSGILLHIVRISGLPMATYVTYMIHLAIAVPMLVVEVPFGKWAHLLYRPLAMYVAAAGKESCEKRMAVGERG
ncbi:MAG TPA: 4Fe-4S dicluster domain-containing protein [Bryobacteraceae bacterium]|nr:4Fe-4S dicluster domain-containing protein [Bryobacteraceae bacterium]